ncbi:MAG: UvrD-helicase domain-containing protein, partial [Planctomycetota bacterium]
MAERKIEWTPQQLRAIAARDRDILVAASAGTGKTAVLSGRCIDIICDKRACSDVFGILVLTFTEAAAEQMRSRIACRLKDAFLQKQDPHLRSQLLLLQAADISTIHSFCKRLITEHFYKLDLDPTFRVIDADEQRLLKAQILEKTVEWAWEQSHLAQGLRQLFYKRNLRMTEGFLAKVITVSDYLDGVVSRDNWYERAAAFAQAANPLAGTLGQKQKQIVAAKLRYILNQLEHARTVYEKQGGAGSWAADFDAGFVGPVAQCIGLLEAGDFDGCAEQIRNFQKPRVTRPKELAEPIAELVRKTIKSAVDSFAGLSDLAVLNPDYLDKISTPAGVQTKVLVELVKKFDRLYGQAKRGLNCLDFADLEHYALKLLSDENSAEVTPAPSRTALALRRRYSFIFVDEYQDINSVQQRILELLGRGDNVFAVGDIKQSIYAWRGAEPDIFLEKLRSASVEPAGAAASLRVDLNANFRSARGILDFVNKVFSRIMTASFTKIDYDESAELRPACEAESERPAQGDHKPIVELHILDTRQKDAADEGGPTNGAVDDEDHNIITGRQRQSAMVARRIRQMVGAETGRPEFKIYDKNRETLRDVEYRDIVILMRSLAKKANDYVEVLRLAGVPVSCD